jgi:hypothetical protein
VVKISAKILLILEVLKMDENYFYELDRLNKIFCKGYCEIAAQTRDYWKRDLDYVPNVSPKYSLYRSIWDSHGMLFVVDADGYGDLKQAFYVMRAVYYLTGCNALVKFSGSKGFHVIQRIDAKSESWKKHADETNAFPNVESYLKATLEGMTRLIKNTTTDEKEARKKNLVCLDAKMFERKRLIRGFSVHLETGLYSVPVFPDEDELEDVLKRARLESPMGLDDVVIPEFNLFGLAQLSTKDKPSTLRRESPSEKTSVGEKTPSPAFRLKDEANVPSCIKLMLSKRNQNPNHSKRFFLVSWLSNQGYSREDILELIRSLGWTDYDSCVTETQVNQILGKDYLPDGLDKRIFKGICTLPDACKDCVMKSLSRGGDGHDDD